jgi:hypothetical protein
MPHTARKTIQKRKDTIKWNVSKDSRNNRKGHIVIQSIQKGNIHRKTDYGSPIADSIHSISFESKDYEHMQLVNGYSDLSIQDENDVIKMIQDVYSSCKDNFKDLNLCKPDLNTWQVFKLLKNHLLYLYPESNDTTLELNYINGNYVVNLKEQFFIDNFYWIDVNWLINECFGDKKLETLCYKTISLLQSFCSIENLGTHEDDDYISRIQCEIETWEEEIKETTDESYIVELLKNIEVCKDDIECYQNGDYNAKNNIIKSYSETTFKSYKKSIESLKSVSNQKILNWIYQCSELIENYTSFNEYCDFDEDHYNNGEVPINSMIRFVYNRLNGDMCNARIEIENCANECGVSCFILNSTITNKKHKTDLPEDLKQILHIMNFENIYEKWT